VASKRALAGKLSVVAGFENPQLGLEQYPTPPDLAAHVIHLADLQGDIAGRTVIDLGAGTGMLTLGAALRGPARVVGVEVDRRQLRPHVKIKTALEQQLQFIGYKQMVVEFHFSYPNQRRS